jgi:hypothetical protein
VPSEQGSEGLGRRIRVDPREETANVAGQRKEFQNKTRSEMN